MIRIDNIINEEINKVVLTEGVLDSIRSLLKDFTSRNKDTKKTEEEIRKERKARKKAEKDKKGRKKLRKRANGGQEYYDYDDYQAKHRKISKADSDSIIDTIDQEKTNIAAVARELFPDHTDEGAQSQLRKILNHERPLPKDLSVKINKMVSGGQIAVK